MKYASKYRYKHVNGINSNSNHAFLNFPFTYFDSMTMKENSSMHIWSFKLYESVISPLLQFPFCWYSPLLNNGWRYIALPFLSIVWLCHSGATCLLLSARHRSSSTHQNLGTLDRNSRTRNKNGSSQSQRKYQQQRLILHFQSPFPFPCFQCFLDPDWTE